MTLKKHADPKMQKIVDDYPELFTECFSYRPPSGWHDLIRELCSSLHALGADVKVRQVKEKFGGLRFYIIDNATYAAYSLIADAEDDSLNICQDCGTKEDAGIRGSTWIRTICGACYDKRMAAL